MTDGTVPTISTSSDASRRTLAAGLRPTTWKRAPGTAARMAGHMVSTKYWTPSMFGSQSIEPRNSTTGSGATLRVVGRNAFVSTPVGTTVMRSADTMRAIASRSASDTAIT
jgi:hypothetical protein